MGRATRVLYVGSEAERAATELEEVDGRLGVEPATSTEEARSLLTTNEFDCVVYETIPSTAEGDEFLDEVLAETPGLPSIVVLDAEPDAVTNEVVPAGVTDYLPGRRESDRYAELGTRIHRAVEREREPGPSTTYRRRFNAVFEDPEVLVGLLAPDGTLLKANHTAMSYVEAEYEDVVGQPFWETPWWADQTRDSVRHWIDRAATGEYVEYQADHTRPDGDRHVVDGTIRPVTDPDGDVISLIASARDVTEREARSRDLELKNRAMDEAPIGIVLTDPTQEDNPIVYANDQFETLTGYARDDVLGRNCRFLQGAETDAERIQEIREAVEAREPVTVELRNYREDGTLFWNRVTIAPVRGDEGEVTHFVGFQQDVTTHKRHEQRLQVLYRILRHNLRNSVNVIHGYAAKILDSVGELPESGRHGDDVADAARTVQETADDLAQIAEKTYRLRRVDASMHQERVTVAELFEHVERDVREEYSTGTLEVSPAATDVRVSRLLEVGLFEAVENAFEHHDGDDPTVELRADVSAENGRKAVVVRVADDGPGIPANERRPVNAGTETSLEHASSVGLWLVKWTVETLDGELEIEDNDPRGSVVTLRVPPAGRPR